jgi:hypothetical protein
MGGVKLPAFRGAATDMVPREDLRRIARSVRIERLARELRRLGHVDLAGQLEFYEHDTLSRRNNPVAAGGV